MKIVHIDNYVNPDMGYQINYLPVSQKMLGHEAYIITSDRYFPFKNFYTLFKGVIKSRYVGIGESNVSGVIIIRLKPVFEIPKHALIKLPSNELLRLLNKIRPDVLHVHDVKNLNMLSAIKYSQKCSCSVLVDCHLDYQNSLPGKPILSSLVYGFLTKYVYKKCISKNIAMFLPINEASKLFLISKLGIDPNQIVINRLGCKTDVFKCNLTDRISIRKQLNINDDEIVIISTGKFTKERRFKLLTDAFHLIEKDRLKVKFLLIGQADPMMHTLIDNLSNIITLNFMPHFDLAKYYSAADIAVWTAASNSILDAMACKCTIILYDELNTNNLVSNGKGLTFKTSRDLYDKLKFLIINNDIRKENSEKAYNHIENQLSWEKIALQTIKLYKEAFTS